MLWFYTRDDESLSLVTRYDNQTLEYVGILTYPDGRQAIERFLTARAFRAWLVSLDQKLLADRWAQHGAPQILPDGWPDKKPTQ
jgi:hypothetical protein